MKQRNQPEHRFRRLAIGAAVSIWFGLILLAVGLVFTFNAPPPARVALVAADMSTPDMGTPMVEAGVMTVDAAASATAEVAAATATAVPSFTPSPAATGSATPEPSATPTATPSATATATVVPTPSATPVRGRPVRIVATSIGMDAAVVEVGWHEEVVNDVRLAVWDVASFAAGWHKTTARPGDVGNIVISGHHNIEGEVFRYLVDLQAGAEIDLYVEGQDAPYVYHVTEVLTLPEKGQPLEVRKANAAYILPTEDERVTLVTCWPYNNNTHRVIVIAKP